MTWGYIGGAAVGVIGGSLLNRGGGNTAPAANQVPAMTPEQQQALQALLQRLQGSGAPGTTPYAQPLSAGMTPGQGTSLAALEQQAMDSIKGLSGAQGAAERAMSDTGADTSDLFTKSVENPARRSFELNTLPDISRRFGGNAIFGSDERTAERNATNDLESNLAGQRSGMVYNAQQAAKDRALKAAGMIPGFAQSGSDILGKLFGAQTLPQQMQQSALDRQYQEFMRQQGGQNTNISQILASLGLQPLNTVVTPGQTGFATAAAPGIGSAFTQYALNRWLRPGTATPDYTGANNPSGMPGSDPGGGP